MEISKADWKLYRERVSDWQEHYMEQLNQEYVNLLTSTGNASDHFWELQKRIKIFFTDSLGHPQTVHRS